LKAARQHGNFNHHQKLAKRKERKRCEQRMAAPY
jgi:hypothetical protein